MNILKTGVTTGSCVAAGTKGALELILNKKINEAIDLISLNSNNISIKVLSFVENTSGAKVVVQKFSGDDPDVTNGIEIEVKIRFMLKKNSTIPLSPKNKKGFFYKDFYLTGGRGIGVVTKRGLQIEPNKFAINLGPQEMVKKIIKEYKKNYPEFFNNNFLIVKASVPKGVEKSKLTLNSKLGIKNGISILGTTGIVKPMSEDALKKSLYTELKVIKENVSSEYVVFSFGNYSEKYCKTLGISSEYIVTISNFIGDMIVESEKLGFKKIILIGHVGKAVKIAGGIFNTHSKVADGRMEIMGANAFLYGESNETVKKILNSNTIEEACDYIENKDFFHFLAEKISQKSREYSKNNLNFETLIFNFKGEPLGKSLKFDDLVKRIVRGV